MKLLLAEDDRIVRITLRDALQEAGFQVTACADGAAAARAADSESFDIVLTDVRMPGLSGVELFRRLRRQQASAVVLLMTAFADTDDAVTVMREGARDYIVKPFEVDELLSRVGRVRQEVDFRKMMAAGGQPAGLRENPIRGSAPATRRLIERVDAAAASDVNVLIVGETGSGKDLCAQTIHARSRRAGRPFIAVSCAAIPETLLESELFGHERGAFTGADRRRVGRFEAANGGTLFLDEIGELSPASQAKLLRAVETSSFEPVGSSATVAVNVRIIAATNRDIAAALERGSFRRDLYFRLNVIDVHAPPLRDRRADIPVLVMTFLAEIAARQGRPLPALGPSAVAALAAHDYPGNVRELIHALERAVAVAGDGVIEAGHLPPDMRAGADAMTGGDAPDGDGFEPLARAVDQFERQYVRHVVDRVGGHRGRAAAVLGISRKSLWQRLREPPE